MTRRVSLKMRGPASMRLVTRLVVLVLLVSAVPIAALAVLYAPPFEPLRRTYVEHLLSDAVDIGLEARGPIAISFAWEPTIAIAEKAANEVRVPRSPDNPTRTALGYEPIAITDGMQRFVDWLRDVGRL